MTAYWCERAWAGVGSLVDGLLIEIDEGRIASTRITPTPVPGSCRLAGLTVPGFANCHSHAFHRALRSRTQRERGTFWTWRDQMYAVAAHLDPDRYYALARATYEEMALAGVAAVGEFHYLHHQPDGTPYDDPNAMGAALVAAARDAGLRIALLDTCYLSAGFGAPPAGVQSRFSDGDADAWSERVSKLRSSAEDDAVVAAAIHSVRAVPESQLATVASALPEAPLHVHLSEQVAENDACREHYGCTPTELLDRNGVLTDRTTAVHATHLTRHDISLLGEARCYMAFCPTTERDLADGIGPSRQLAGSGSRLTLGSDGHSVIDLCEEMRAVELNERLASKRRGHWSAGELLTAATSTGHESLGFADAGRLEPGCRADLVTFSTSSPRTAGTGGGAEAVVFAATASDITSVVIGGRRVDLDPADVAARLERAINEVVAPR